MKGFYVVFEGLVKIEANNKKEAREKLYSMFASIWDEDEGVANIRNIVEEAEKGE